MAPISVKVRIAAALSAIALAGGVVACDSDRDRYDRCDDYSCGDGLFFAPIFIPAYGSFGQPGYRPGYTLQPSDPRYPKDRPSYVGKPPNFKPPQGAKVNPPTAKPPSNYKPPTGSTLTVQKAPKASGNVKPPSSGGSSSSGGGSKQTVQKAPSGGSKSSSGSSGGSRSGGSSSSGRTK